MEDVNPIYRSSSSTKKVCGEKKKRVEENERKDSFSEIKKSFLLKKREVWFMVYRDQHLQPTNEY